MRAHGPWIIEDTAEKFVSPFARLQEDRVKTPEGSPGSYVTVALKPGVAILPFNSDGTVHLTRQFRYAIGRDSVEVPSGALENGEDPLRAAERELREELGIIANEWTDLGSFDMDTSIVQCPVRLFTADALRMTHADPDPTESIRGMTVSFDAAVDMVMKGQITHAPSCVLILKAERHRRGSSR